MTHTGVRVGQRGKFTQHNVCPDPREGPCHSVHGTTSASASTNTSRRARWSAASPRDTAEEIAARTVNKERARAGEAATASPLSINDMSSGERGGHRSHTGAGRPYP
jgi:hypothetical protein